MEQHMTQYIRKTMLEKKILKRLTPSFFKELSLVTWFVITQSLPEAKTPNLYYTTHASGLDFPHETKKVTQEKRDAATFSQKKNKILRSKYRYCKS